MTTAATTGQAAGTAAALACTHKTSPRGVYQSYLAELQQRLLRDGCYIPGLPNSDPLDLARKATATASSAAKGAEPANAVNGWNRVVGKNRNAWAPAPQQQPPHWLQLDLTEPAPLREIHLTFEKQGADCRLELRQGGAWQQAAAIPARSARRHVLKVGAGDVDAIRVVADSDSSIGICEIRAYR